MELKFKKLHEDAILPSRAYAGDAGFDLYSIEDTWISKKGYRLVGTGLAVEIPYGFAGLVQPRSGLAAKHGITVLNSPGLIDSGYRGEILVNLINHGNNGMGLTINKGDKIAQLVLTVSLDFHPVEAEELSKSHRDIRGHGSSGT